MNGHLTTVNIYNICCVYPSQNSNRRMRRETKITKRMGLCFDVDNGDVSMVGVDVPLPYRTSIAIPILAGYTRPSSPQLQLFRPIFETKLDRGTQ